jgi:hypothetical protein
MTRRVPCPPAPGLLEDHAARFDEQLASVAQRRALREYLHGLPLPRERSKTLTGLAGTEPVVGAQAAPAQRLQWFLSEPAWDAGAITDRRLELLIADPTTRPHEGGVLVIDETGDRKDGTKAAHVAHQDRGSVGRLANGIGSVTSLRADEGVYSPLRVAPPPRRGGWPGARPTPPSAPSRGSRSRSSTRPSTRAAPSGRWSPTASTARTRRSRRRGGRGPSPV